ncbi:unnamed protein product [Cercopithifilaria johnstoni]|uniref:Uncharacterized protein n=1 Tax=Cercopithifilaria johnstoni TaxID=2874296 RepID=A0A8J2MG50_9BILA|nr:unnamed protein product [Cercopithifilaria johnstoni]
MTDDISSSPSSRSQSSSSPSPPSPSSSPSPSLLSPSPPPPPLPPSPPPPPYNSLPFNDEMKLTNFSKSQRYPESVEMLQQSQYPLSQCLRKTGIQSPINPAVQSSVPIEPIIMPIMMSQTTSYPCQQKSDRPLNVTINANGKTEGNSFERDYRICNFCKRGIMTKKKYMAILLLFNLLP